MNEKPKYGILWKKWLGTFAAIIWIVGTYIGLLLGIVVLGASTAKGTVNPHVEGAVAGVLFATFLHWMLFAMIEHGHIKSLNEEK